MGIVLCLLPVVVLAGKCGFVNILFWQLLVGKCGKFASLYVNSQEWVLMVILKLSFALAFCLVCPFK